MGLLNALKKIFQVERKYNYSNEKNENSVRKSSYQRMTNPDIPNIEQLIKQAIPSKQGLYPHEILALHYAEKYYLDKNEFQQFWFYQYGITNVQTLLNSLLERGFLQVGGLQPILKKQKVVDLKEILKNYDLKRTGKKAELINRILDSVPECELNKSFPRRTYALTEKGKESLKEGAYVPYIHRNNIEDLDIWKLNKLVHKPPYMPYRDKIWGYLNKCSIKHSSKNDFGLYRNCRSKMAALLFEENKIKDALSLFAEVIFIDLSGVGNGFNPEYDIDFDNFFPYENSMVTIPPGIISDLVDCQNKLEYSDAELKMALFERMEKLKMPFHPFTVEECVQIVIFERDQNIEALHKIYSEAGRRFKKNYHK